ncbi:uncharacterized protein LOC136039461 isoform X2 [Artemia franciscana]|uniref:uncharacterized protein LOC136039461 isoform X2 n=1 Tax=Artemia franciscana TaxID=6661 RepID=UPI0032DAFE5E
MTIIVAKLGIILLLWDASLAANSSASEDQRNLGVFNRRWECDPLAVYPCGTLDTSAICTLVHEKFVCYCTAPFYILDEDTGLCTYPVFVFTQVTKKAGTSTGITAIVLGSIAVSYAQNKWCYTNEDTTGLKALIPHWMRSGNPLSAFRCPNLENYITNNESDDNWLYDDEDEEFEDEDLYPDFLPNESMLDSGLTFVKNLMAWKANSKENDEL